MFLIDRALDKSPKDALNTALLQYFMIVEMFTMSKMEYFPPPSKIIIHENDLLYNLHMNA